MKHADHVGLITNMNTQREFLLGNLKKDSKNSIRSAWEDNIKVDSIYKIVQNKIVCLPASGCKIWLLLAGLVDLGVPYKRDNLLSNWIMVMLMIM